MSSDRSRRHSVLAAVDFSPESREALRAARGLADATDSLLTVAHVRPFSDVRAAVQENRGELLKRKTTDLRGAMADHYADRLDGMVRESRGERLLLLRGKPSEELCREASRNHDFLVMGSRGRGKVASTLLGSTVQEVLTLCRVPVVVIPARASGVRRGARGTSRRS